jgi:Xaa-Pro dipeptidase
MVKQDRDAFLITKVSSVYYFSGFLDHREAVLALIVPVDGRSTLLAHEISYDAAKDQAVDCDVELVKTGEKMLDKIANELLTLKVRKVSFDHLSSRSYLSLSAKLAKVELKDAPNAVWDLRKVKDDDELECLRRAARMADRGMEAAMENLREGMRECDLAAEIEYAMRREGSECFAFDTIVASGPRSFHPHTLCSSKKIERGDLVIVDVGAVYKGYRSDETRTLIVGSPNKKQAEIFSVTLSAHDEALAAMKEGASAKHVDRIARDIITKAGYGNRFVHGLGHGIGLDIHEPPSLSPTSNDVLQKGNVVTDEPAIYIPRLGGVRIEDTVLVKENACEKLTLSLIQEV